MIVELTYTELLIIDSSLRISSIDSPTELIDSIRGKIQIALLNQSMEDKENDTAFN